MTMRKPRFYTPRSLLLAGCLAFFAMACSDQPRTIAISTDTGSPMIHFAMEELNDVLQEKGIGTRTAEDEDADIIFSVQPGALGLNPEGFSIRKSQGKIRVTAADEAGGMYGGLELAEQLRIFGLDGVEEMTRNPYMEMRGTKFNIPLDVRTPSYTDVCDAAQKNIPEMWSFDFWKEYIDNLARYRYNFISLWSLHPFPSLVKVPEYPDVALEDVQRSTADFKEYYSLNGLGFDAPEILANPEIVKEMTTGEKIEFWRKVMAYGKSRNIDFYVVTWNIFVYGTGGKYGITDEIGNETTRDYFRKSVKQMFITYPDLAGIGLTTGENMPGAGFEEMETWAFETYAQGVLDAAAEMPGRKFTFIHRQHMTGAKDIARRFKALIEHPNVEFIFSFKYAKAHVFSATEQPYHEAFVKDIQGMKTIWTLRNDDNYQYRWGAPDFVREFIQNIPYDVSRGFYYGSDQWIWGREFLSKQPEDPRQIEIVKHWYHWMLWGRLGYDPGLTNERFVQILQYRFPEADGQKLFTAWQEASMIYPTTTGFHWGSLDFQWYIEACKSHPVYSGNETGFHDVNRFISLPPHPKSGCQSIPDYVTMTVDGGSSDLFTPFEVSQKLHDHSDKALEIIKTMDGGGNKELNVTLNDIRTISLLGKYYAHKIAGSTDFGLFRETREKKYQAEAIRELSRALDYWQQYVEMALQQNINPLWTNRVGYVDFKKITAWVGQDIDIVKSE
jgi:hypothetical protein